MVAGHLREKRGYYHMVLSYTDKNGKRQTPSKSTGLVVKGNKKRAEKMLNDWRSEVENILQWQVQQSRDTNYTDASDILFTQFLLDWLEMMKNCVEMTTYANYSQAIKSRITPYFDEKHPGLLLREVTAKHIQDYYTYELNVRKVSANTVKHRHANIRKALQYAYQTDLIATNPADKVQLPKTEEFEGNYYNEKELKELFSAAKGDRLELGIILASFYGLRRSEVVGLKWSAIDFDNKTITIRHIVTEAVVDGKTQLIQKNRTKTKSSHRTLPLIEPFEELLIRLKKEQMRNRILCGSAYCTDYLEYIYVNEIGELVKPGFITQHFPLLLEKNGLRKIRFHDLRHSCASLLYANGVLLKDIQAWLGHSNISTTANIYTHMDYSNKVASANAIMSIYPQEERETA